MALSIKRKLSLETLRSKSDFDTIIIFNLPFEDFK